MVDGNPQSLYRQGDFSFQKVIFITREACNHQIITGTSAAIGLQQRPWLALTHMFEGLTFLLRAVKNDIWFCGCACCPCARCHFPPSGSRFNLKMCVCALLCARLCACKCVRACVHACARWCACVSFVAARGSTHFIPLGAWWCYSAVDQAVRGD